MDTIVLVTNNEDIKQKLQNNLVLLRKTDKLISVNYDNAKEVIEEFCPAMIIMHENTNRQTTTELTKYIRNKKMLASSYIILLMNKFDGNFLIQSYDIGVQDYFCSSSEPEEMLIRVINGVRHQQLKNKFNRYSGNLEHYGIIDTKSKFYSAKTAPEIINYEMGKNNYNGGCFLILSLDEECKKNYDYDKMLSAINRALRLNDIVISYSASKFGILFESGIEECFAILDRIKADIPKDWIFRAGIVSVSGINYSELEKRATCALNNSVLENKEYSIYSEEAAPPENWLQTEPEQKNIYKFYKKAFSQKIENIISPILYRVQKAYEDKIGDARIEQFADEKQSVLRILQGKKESRLSMLYPGYSKLVIYISHSGLDSPENREVTVPLKEITSSKISEIVEGFINEFIGVYRHSK